MASKLGRVEEGKMMNLKRPLVLLFCLLSLVPPAFSEQQKPFKRTLSLKLTGGGGFAFIGSVNRSLKLLNNNESFQDLRENDPDSISGEIRGLNNWLVDWEIELKVDLSPKISIGIAASAPYHCRKESSLSYAMFEDGKRGPRIRTLLYRPEATVSVPIKVDFYYSRRYWKKPKLILNGGIGYYPARLSQYASAWIDGSWSGSSYWEVEPEFPFGLHGGVSLEYPLLKNFVMVLDIQARYVHLGNLKGRQEEKWGDGTHYERTGTLYSYEWFESSFPAYCQVTEIPVWETPSGYEKNAALDLTGIVLRLGFRVPLF